MRDRATGSATAGTACTSGPRRVPIFVLSRREADSEMEQWPLVTYVNDVRTAMSEAKLAAGDKNVLVHAVSSTTSVPSTSS